MPSLHKTFPQNIHLMATYNSSLPSRKLQERIVRLFYQVNGQEFEFEEVANPTIPDGTVIFNIGLAGEEKFNLINSQQVSEAIKIINEENLQTIDFYIVIRYYKGKLGKKIPLRFDYYLMRTLFGREILELQIAHDSGPRYITPEDLSAFLFTKLNEGSKKQVLTSTD